MHAYSVEEINVKIWTHVYDICGFSAEFATSGAEMSSNVEK